DLHKKSRLIHIPLNINNIQNNPFHKKRNVFLLHDKRTHSQNKKTGIPMPSKHERKAKYWRDKCFLQPE
ncbi:MAG: hypothetical protein Q4A50_06480, partial [Bacteroidales bacterium]|nr:hypothetical protein [Bacteroidales bacterium]